MKKTIAKIMAAAMLVASMPAMVLPTFTVDAASGISVGCIKFNGTYAAGAYKYPGTNDNRDAVIKTTADGIDSILKFDAYYGMKTTATNMWNTKIQYFSDTKTDANKNADATSKISNHSFNAGSADTSFEAAGDYIDSTGVVKSVKTNNDGELVIEFDASKLTTYQNDLLKGAKTAQTIKFYPFNVMSGDHLVPAIEIQLGETLINGKNTKINHVSTPDEGIQDATIEITKAGYAVLKTVTDNDKKVNMKDKDIEVSTVYVSGIEYPIRKFDDKVLKKGTMKTITAKEVKHLGTGALRNCKKLRKVRMGSAKMRKIHSNAFYDCGKLKNIKINCKNLKAVGSKAFKALKKNCTISIKANKTKYNQVVKMIKKSGTDKVKFKRV